MTEYNPTAADLDASSSLQLARSPVETTQDASDFLRLLVDALPGYVYEWDVTSGVVMRDPALPALLGFEPHDTEPDASWWHARSHPDDLAGLIAEARARFADPDVLHTVTEYRVRHRYGTWRWVADRARLVRDSEGRVVRVVGITTDITAEREQREALALLDDERRRRLESQEILAAASAVLGQLLEPRETAIAIAHAAIPAFADWAVVDALDADGRFARLALAHSDPALLEAAEALDRRWPPDFERPAGTHTVIATGEPLLLAEIRDEDFAPLARDAEHFAAWQAFRVRSCVAVPLTASGEQLGVLTLLAAEGRRRYSADDLPLAMELGRRAATALLNARLFARERRAHARAERLQGLTAALARTLTASEVATAAISEAGRAVGAISGTIAVLDEDGSHFTLLPGPGMPADVAQEWRRFPNVGASPAATAVRTLQPCYSPTRADFVARNPAFAAIVDRVGLEANAALPLAVDVGTPAQRIFGVLTFAFGEPRVFGGDDDAFLRAAADQCAQALDRARAYEAERRARADAEAAQERADRLRALTAALGVARTPDDVAATIAREGVRTLGALSAGVGLLEEGGAQFRFIQLLGTDAETAAAWEHFPNVRAIPFGEAVASRRVLCLASHAAVADQFPSVASELQRRGLEALVVLPLLDGRGHALGAVHLAFDKMHEFDTAEVREFEDLAQACAQALERARAFDAERAARAAAEAANRAKMDFLATMSHELRTPLNAIGGYAELIALGVRGPVTSQQQEDLARIQRSQQHLLGLINEVLNYARLETGTVRYDITTVAVAGVLGGLEAMFAPQVRAKALRLTVEACDPSLGVQADAEKLRQVLLNLLSNAVKFTPPGGAIDVRCRVRAGVQRDDARRDDARRDDALASPERGTDNGVVEIFVEDTGVGIAPEQHAAVFEPFVQVGRALNAPGEGTGLGLAISRDLARGMGGDLTVESRLGAGSTFTLVLRGA
ncbi:MAG TPA: GAF domain-containing protein [Gemmatimonas sp.]|nr:GAF domain-containing protein [Gemmatimonas sp.]